MMLKRFADSWSRYRKYRATVWELGGLNDRELADLGIHAARQSPMQLYAQKRDAARRQRLGAAESQPVRREHP